MEINRIKKKIIESLKIDFSPLLEQKLDIYFQELSKWNQKVNLCGLINEEIFWVKHLADSWLGIEAFKESKKVADIGSGAGFPGIPLKLISPHLKLTLIEKNFKKVIFLNTLLEKLELRDCHVYQGKIEKTFSPSGKRYDTIILRALKVDENIEPGVRNIIEDKGCIVLYNTPDSDSALLLKESGWTLIKVIEKTLPIYNHPREISIFQSISRETIIN